MTGFDDRVAIVTGAGAPDGIGLAVARLLVSRGARVVLGATSDRVHDRAAELGPAAAGVACDLTVDGSAQTLLEEVRNGITVNVVAPGYVATGSQLPFEAGAATAGPFGRSGTPEEIAACIGFLAHESASFVTGAVLVADGGHGLPETWPRPE